jgi:sulfate permease, SulP family
VVPTVIAVLWAPEGVKLVSDVSEIPRGLPPLGVPALQLVTVDLVISAFALAVIIAIQGAGISQSYKNPDGTSSDPSRDMFAQGAANVAASLVSGMPTGGSVGQTALAASTGARSRLTGVFHGLCMLAIILLVPGLVSVVPMPVLAAVMIVAGFSAVRFRAMAFVWRTGGPARWVLVLTFLATLLVSIAAAVATGVVAAVVLYLYTSVSRVRVNGLEPRDDGRIHVVDVPKKLPDQGITVIDVYGSPNFPERVGVFIQNVDQGRADLAVPPQAQNHHRPLADDGRPPGTEHTGGRGRHPSTSTARSSRCTASSRYRYPSSPSISLLFLPAIRLSSSAA